MTQCRHSHLALLEMLNKDGKINNAIIKNMLSWRHSGFHVYLDPTISPDISPGRVSLQQRMVYIPREDAPDGIAKFIYPSKNGLSQKTFDALE